MRFCTLRDMSCMPLRTAGPACACAGAASTIVLGAIRIAGIVLLTVLRISQHGCPASISRRCQVYLQSHQASWPAVKTDPPGPVFLFTGLTIPTIFPFFSPLCMALRLALRFRPASCAALALLLSTLGAAPLALAADAVLVLDTSHRQETREAPALDLAITRFAGNASGTYYWEDGQIGRAHV